MNCLFAFLGVGGGEVIVILVVVLLLFGAKKLPELAKGLGQGIREFKKASSEVTDELLLIRLMASPSKPATDNVVIRTPSMAGRKRSARRDCRSSRRARRGRRHRSRRTPTSPPRRKAQAADESANETWIPPRKPIGSPNILVCHDGILRGAAWCRRSLASR